MSDQSLRDALEKLLQQKEAEPDRRPRDKYGPIGRKPDPAIRVSVLRDLLAAHPAEGSWHVWSDGEPVDEAELSANTEMATED